MHTHTLRVLLPNRKSYQRKDPTGVSTWRQGEEQRRGICPWEGLTGSSVMRCSACVCGVKDVIDRAHLPLATEVHSSWPTGNTPHPQLPSTADVRDTQEVVLIVTSKLQVVEIGQKLFGGQEVRLDTQGQSLKKQDERWR